jgi:hypothetical protein
MTRQLTAALTWRVEPPGALEYLVVDAEMWVVAATTGASERERRDAYLLAAAPELLVAAEVALEAIGDVRTLHEARLYQQHRHTVERLRAAFHALRRAIQKAEAPT